jgi:hypothetical protein
MPTLTEVTFDGFEEKVARLGLVGLMAELREIVSSFSLFVEERKDSNSGAALREMLDERFSAARGWTITKSGGIDWQKCHTINGTSVCIGVEVQMSARSDMLVMDIHHLRSKMVEGAIDVGVLVVPDDALSYFLTDRAPSLSAAKRHVNMAKAEDLPLLLIGLGHDGVGPALPKRKTR